MNVTFCPHIIHIMTPTHCGGVKDGIEAIEADGGEGGEGDGEAGCKNVIIDCQDVINIYQPRVKLAEAK